MRTSTRCPTGGSGGSVSTRPLAPATMGRAGTRTATVSRTQTSWPAAGIRVGCLKRYLAEGATSPTFFDVSVNIANAGDTPASAVVQFLDSRGTVTSQSYRAPAGRRLSVNPKGLPSLAQAEFSTLVESDRPLVVSRTMAWEYDDPLRVARRAGGFSPAASGSSPRGRPTRASSCSTCCRIPTRRRRRSR